VTRPRGPRGQIEAIIFAESGASFQELAERTESAYAQVRAAVWVLYGQKRADICRGYVVAVPSADAGRRAA
jgi:hypothetical protein